MRAVKKTYYEMTVDDSVENLFVRLAGKNGNMDYDSLQDYFDDTRKYLPEFYAMMQKTSRMYGSEYMHTLANAMLQMYEFYKHGKKIFNLSNGLVNALIHTNTDKCSTEFLRLPFHSVCLSFPDSYFTLTDKSTGEHRVKELYIVEDECGDDVSWRIFVVGEANKNSVDEFDDCVFFFRTRITGGSMVGDGFSLLGDNKFETTSHLEQTDVFWKFTSAIILYINSSEFRSSAAHNQFPVRPANKKKARRYDREYGRLSRLGFHNIGKDIGIDGKSYGGVVPTNLCRQWKVSYRFMVRGHMHTFLYGKKDEERIKKLRWIRPFWKGPELADVVRKEYSVR